MYKILIEKTHDKNGNVTSTLEFIHAEDARVNHPFNAGETITPAEFIGFLNDNPALRESGGWHVASQYPTEDKPVTRWARLVAHTNSPEGHPELQKLGIKE